MPTCRIHNVKYATYGDCYKCDREGLPTASSRSPGCSTADETIERLRGQLQNCVNHMDGVKRRFPSLANRLDPAIESANKALYETLSR